MQRFCQKGFIQVKTLREFVHRFLKRVLYDEWAIPENIHTIPRTAFRISEGEGGFTIMDSAGMGGIYDWKSEGMGEFHRWDFWSRKCRVSSLKTLLLWTFVVRK